MIKGEKISIPLETILYFESNYRTIIVHTKYGKYEFYDKLNCVQEKLKNVSFLRCHQSYLVAAQKITDCLKEIWPEDPCRGDFALFGLGVDKNP